MLRGNSFQSQNVLSAILHKLLEFQRLILGPPAALGQRSVPVPWGFKNWLGCVQGTVNGENVAPALLLFMGEMPLPCRSREAEGHRSN